MRRRRWRGWSCRAFGCLRRRRGGSGSVELRSTPRADIPPHDAMADDVCILISFPTLQYPVYTIDLPPHLISPIISPTHFFFHHFTSLPFHSSSLSLHASPPSSHRRADHVFILLLYRYHHLDIYRPTIRIVEI
jgi:hypothetical protein